MRWDGGGVFPSRNTAFLAGEMDSIEGGGGAI